MTVNEILNRVMQKAVLHFEDFTIDEWREIISCGIIAQIESGQYMFGKRIIGIELFQHEIFSPNYMAKVVNELGDLLNFKGMK